MEQARRKLRLSTPVAARALLHEGAGGRPGETAIYTLADPRDAPSPRYVGQTRAPRRRYAQHVHTARLWLPDEQPWWVRSPKHRPLYEWIRALHRDGNRLPFMLVTEWVGAGRDPRAAERAAIMEAILQGAALLNAEARLLGAQLPLL
jgi:hypothetical protein